MSKLASSGMEWLERRERVVRLHAGDGVRVQTKLDLDAALAPRPASRPVRRRQHVDGHRTYTAFDAHSLLEDTNPSNHARPGHPY